MNPGQAGLTSSSRTASLAPSSKPTGPPGPAPLGKETLDRANNTGACSSGRPAWKGTRCSPPNPKTAVGLHRAAYLLYTLRESLGRTGVLVVGPNPAFIRYVARATSDGPSCHAALYKVGALAEEGARFEDEEAQ